MPIASPILLAEDDPHGVELMLGVLRRMGLHESVQVVHDGEECLDYLHRRGQFADFDPGNPKVLLLDLNMPKVGGLEVLHELRTTPALASIPVVTITSSKDEKDILEAYRLGTNAYIVKPIDVTSFMEVIDHVVNFWGQLNEPPPEGIPTT